MLARQGGTKLEAGRRGKPRCPAFSLPRPAYFLAAVGAEPGSPCSGPNIGGGTRRFDAAWYADAAFSVRCSMPGSAQKLIENGSPGAGISVGVVLVLPR